MCQVIEVGKYERLGGVVIGVIVFRGTMKDGSQMQLQQMEDGSWVVRIERGNTLTLMGWRKVEGHAKGVGFHFPVQPSANFVSVN